MQGQPASVRASSPFFALKPPSLLPPASPSLHQAVPSVLHIGSCPVKAARCRPAGAFALSAEPLQAPVFIMPPSSPAPVAAPVARSMAATAIGCLLFAVWAAATPPVPSTAAAAAAVPVAPA
eukprot:scaffold705_cov119-Isochrysis_galbana.AAC.4